MLDMVRIVGYNIAEDGFVQIAPVYSEDTMNYHLMNPSYKLVSDPVSNVPDGSEENLTTVFYPRAGGAVVSNGDVCVHTDSFTKVLVAITRLNAPTQVVVL